MSDKYLLLLLCAPIPTCSMAGYQADVAREIYRTNLEFMLA